MNGGRLRLGAFGVGRMGQVHLEHLIALHLAGEIELVAIGDRFGPILSSASLLVNELGGPDLAGIGRFDQPDAMAAAARFDGAIVASRTADHARDSLAFTRGGTPVLVEKPFASSIAEAADLCGRLGDGPNRLVQVGFQRHFDAAGRVALDWMSSGRIGSLQQSHHVLQDKNPTPVGYQSCGITADMAIHLVFEAMSVHGFELPSSVQALRFAAPHYDDRAGEGATSSTPSARGPMARSHTSGDRGSTAPDMTTASSSLAPEAGLTSANSSEISGPSRHGCGAAPAATAASRSKRRRFR